MQMEMQQGPCLPRLRVSPARVGSPGSLPAQGRRHQTASGPARLGLDFMLSPMPALGHRKYKDAQSPGSWVQGLPRH